MSEPSTTGYTLRDMLVISLYPEPLVVAILVYAIPLCLLYNIKKENSKAVLTSFSPKSSRVNHVHVYIVVLYTAALSNSLG